MSEYSRILLISLSIPLVLSFYKPLGFYKNIKALFWSIFAVLVVFGGWDVWATAAGHWWFAETGVSGFYIINLPWEEWLFFLVIPFCCLFTWEVVKFFWRDK